jgi:hypothetical protein
MSNGPKRVRRYEQQYQMIHQSVSGSIGAVTIIFIRYTLGSAKGGPRAVASSSLARRKQEQGGRKSARSTYFVFNLNETNRNV